MAKRELGINKYDRYIFYLIVSLCLGGFGGSLMVVRVLSILLIPALFNKMRHCKDYVRKYFNVFLVFYAFCFLSLIWTPDKDQALKELLYYPVHFLIFFEILIFSRFSNSPLKTISMSWLVCVGLTLLVAVWEITTSNHLSLSKFEAGDIVLNLGGVITERPFAAVTFGNFNGYVTFLCFALPFLFYCLQQYNKKVKLAVVSIGAILTTIVVILVDASRGGLITVLIMAAIFFFMSKRSPYKFLAVIIAIAFVIYYIIPHMDTLFLGISVRAEGNSLYTDDGRMAIWSDGLKVLINYAFIGSGVGSISAAMKSVTNGISITHNIFLEVLVQYGVVFFAFFIAYIIELFFRAVRCRDKNIKMIMYMALIAFPVYGIIDSGYLLNPVLYAALSSLTVFAYVDKIQPQYNQAS